MEPLQPVTPTFLAILVLARSPSFFGKGQAGGSHGGTLSRPPARGSVGIRAPFLTRNVSHPRPPLMDSTDGLPLQPQLLLPPHLSSQLGKGSLSPQPPSVECLGARGERGKGRAATLVRRLSRFPGCRPGCCHVGADGRGGKHPGRLGEQESLGDL